MAAFDITPFAFTYTTGVATAGRFNVIKPIASNAVATTLTTLTPTANLLTIATTGGTPVLSGAAMTASNWTISGGATTISVLGVSIVGTEIRLVTSNQQPGVSYTLTVPLGVVEMVLANPALGPTGFVFSGVSTPVTILATISVDARAIEVIFSIDVLQVDALNLSNYSVNNGLVLVSVSMVSPSVYRFVTSRQSSGVTYTITITGVRDNSGNPI